MESLFTVAIVSKPAEAMPCLIAAFLVTRFKEKAGYDEQNSINR